MSEFFQFVILGLGVGSIYALLGQGLLVVYRGSGVVNFAQGGFALVGAIAFVELRESLGTIGALIGAIAIGAALGVLTQNLIMRPLRGAAPIARVIATLGLLIVLQSAGFLKYGSTPISVPQYLPRKA